MFAGHGTETDLLSDNQNVSPESIFLIVMPGGYEQPNSLGVVEELT